MIPAGLDALQLRLLRNSVLDDATGCWVWLGKHNRKGGYPALNMRIAGKHRTFYAHRVSYAVFRGDIEYGMSIDHTCENPSCINPDHLKQVTAAENSKLRWERRK
jgi:hypothetical protein